MNSSRLNFILWTATGALYVAALGAVVVGITWPLEHEAPGAVAVAQGSGTTRPADSDSSTLTESELDRPLRSSLTASVTVTRPAAETAEDAPAGSGPFVLLGTIGQSLAIVKAPDGAIATVGVDDRIGDARIAAIRASEIDVQLDGKTITLHRATEAAPATFESPVMTAK